MELTKQQFLELQKQLRALAAFVASNSLPLDIGANEQLRQLENISEVNDLLGRVIEIITTEGE